MNFIGGLFAAVRGFFGNGAGAAVGTGVTSVARLAALAPVAIWIISNKDEQAVSFAFTYGQLAVVGTVLWLMVEIIRASRPGSPTDRG